MVNVTIFCVLSSNSTQAVIYIELILEKKKELILDGETSEFYLGGWLTYRSWGKGFHIIYDKRILKQRMSCE